MIDINDQYNVASRQRILLSMLVDFHDFCVKNNIAYSLTGGTLLGAIREKGFIPWDDDIDILMDRPNFEKLRREFSKLDHYNLREVLWVYKIVDKAVNDADEVTEETPVIDVFAVDRVPSGRIKKKLKIFGLKTLQGMIKTRVNPNKDFSLGYRIALSATRLLGKLFSTEKKREMYHKLSIWGNNEADRPLMVCSDPFRCLACEYDPELMNEYINVEFEGMEFMAIKRWDNYLAEQYGDYMTPVRMEH